MAKRGEPISAFDLPRGRVLGGKYEVISKLGAGWEGEVYKVVEKKTGATRAAKLFYPQRNVGDRTLTRYAKRLERLRDCSVLIQYHHSEAVRVRGAQVTALVSEYVEGELLEKLVARQPGGRMELFEALSLLRTLAAGLEEVHSRREYHGDLHWGNVLVSRRGVHFDVKLVDMYDWGRTSTANRQEDVLNLVRLFCDAVGGAARYASQPDEVKAICRGLKRGLILERFPDVRRLRLHLDRFDWSSR